MNRILVVEDDEHDTEFLLRVLNKFPTDVVACTTAQRARELFDNHPFHAVMVNLSLPMPEPDGLYLIQWLRKRSQEITIIVVTGAEDPRRRSQAIELGANGFFTKPYTSEDNLILLAQLEVLRTARERAYAKGKRLKHWRTTYGGAFTATGLMLFGGPMAVSQTSFEVPGEMMKVCIWAGLIMTVAGYFLTQLATADKKVVEENLREQRAVNFVAEVEKKQTKGIES